MLPAKQGVQQSATPLTKQQKKKRRQQKKAAQPSASPSQSPERESAGSVDPLSQRVTQSGAAQDQSMPQAPPEPNATSETESSHASPTSPVDEGPPTDQQQAESAKDQGNTQYKAAQYDAALLSYGKAIALCPEVAAYYGNRAAAALMKKQYKLAVQDSLQATKLNNKFARGYQRAGVSLLMSKIGRSRLGVQ